MRDVLEADTVEEGDQAASDEERDETDEPGDRARIDEQRSQDELHPDRQPEHAGKRHHDAHGRSGEHAGDEDLSRFHTTSLSERTLHHACPEARAYGPGTVRLLRSVPSA